MEFFHFVDVKTGIFQNVDQVFFPAAQFCVAPGQSTEGRRADDLPAESDVRRQRGGQDTNYGGRELARAGATELLLRSVLQHLH